MKKKLLFMMAAVVLAVIAPGCLSTNGPSNTGDTRDLGSVEIREYEGKDLSSIEDFRENSIKGLQYIDLATYKLKVSGLVESPTEYTLADVIENHQSYKNQNYGDRKLKSNQDPAEH